MKKIILGLLALITFGTAVSAIASSQGAYAAPATDTSSNAIYVFGAGGYGIALGSNKYDGSLTKRNSFAINAGVGYQLNKYFAVEGGYLRLPSVQTGSSQAVGFIPDPRAPLTIPATQKTTNKYSFNGVDVAVKGIYPISKRFDVFGKAGAAWVWAKDQQTVVTDNASTGVRLAHSSSTVKFSKLVPLFGLGTDIHLTQNIDMTIQELSTIGLGKGVKRVPTTFMTLVGLGYRFNV